MLELRFLLPDGIKIEKVVQLNDNYFLKKIMTEMKIYLIWKIQLTFQKKWILPSEQNVSEHVLGTLRRVFSF